MSGLRMRNLAAHSKNHSRPFNYFFSPFPKYHPNYTLDLESTIDKAYIHGPLGNLKKFLAKYFLTLRLYSATFNESLVVLKKSLDCFFLDHLAKKLSTICTDMI